MLDVPEASHAKIYGDTCLVFIINWNRWYSIVFGRVLLVVVLMSLRVVFVWIFMGFIPLSNILFGYVFVLIWISNILCVVVRGLILPWIHWHAIIFQSLIPSIDVSFVLLSVVMDRLIFGCVLGNIRRGIVFLDGGIFAYICIILFNISVNSLISFLCLIFLCVVSFLCLILLSVVLDCMITLIGHIAVFGFIFNVNLSLVFVNHGLIFERN